MNNVVYAARLIIPVIFVAHLFNTVVCAQTYHHRLEIALSYGQSFYNMIYSPFDDNRVDEGPVGVGPGCIPTESCRYLNHIINNDNFRRAHNFAGKILIGVLNKGHHGLKAGVALDYLLIKSQGEIPATNEKGEIIEGEYIDLSHYDHMFLYSFHALYTLKKSIRNNNIFWSLSIGPGMVICDFYHYSWNMGDHINLSSYGYSGYASTLFEFMLHKKMGVTLGIDYLKSRINKIKVGENPAYYYHLDLDRMGLSLGLIYHII